MDKMIGEVKAKIEKMLYENNPSRNTDNHILASSYVYMVAMLAAILEFGDLGSILLILESMRPCGKTPGQYYRHRVFRGCDGKCNFWISGHLWRLS